MTTEYNHRRCTSVRCDYAPNALDCPSRASLDEVLDCDNCGHPLSLHDPKYGCEFERGDFLIGDAEFLQAVGPCGCLTML